MWHVFWGLFLGTSPRKGGETPQEVLRAQTKGGLDVCSVSDGVNHRGTWSGGDGQHYVVGEGQY